MENKITVDFHRKLVTVILVSDWLIALIKKTIEKICNTVQLEDNSDILNQQRSKLIVNY